MANDPHPNGGHDDAPGATIVVHIDRKRFEAPTAQMSGSQLRGLPQPPIGPDRDLWREVPGGDDDLVGDDEIVDLKNGMHFYTAPSTINPG